MIASEEVDRQLENDAMPYLFDNYYTRDVYHFAMEQTRQTKNRLEKFSKFAEMLDPRKRRERGAHRNQVNRIIQLNDSDSNKHFGSNVVRSAKYNIYNVVPKFFYEQLTRLANIYFLVTGILYLVDAISPTKTGSRYGQIISFTAVITITAIKEAYEDFWRHREDFRLNRNEATVNTFLPPSPFPPFLHVSNPCGTRGTALEHFCTPFTPGSVRGCVWCSWTIAVPRT